MATITSAAPGNLVVPLSAIIDQLQGKLSAADLNALLLAVTSGMKNEVRPGDLITADLMNQLLSDVADLQVRVAGLEQGNGQGSTGPTIGFIAVSYQGSSRGTNVVPGDSKAFPNTFALLNKTNKDLTFNLLASVSGTSGGNWSQSATFDNNMNSRSLVIPANVQGSVTANVRAPSTGSVIGDTPVLTLSATVAGEEGLVGGDTVKLLVATTTGGTVVRTLRLTDVAEPLNFRPGPAGADGKIALGKTGTFGLSYKYDDASAVPPDPGFSLVVTLQAADTTGTDPTSLWDVEMQGASPDSDNTAGGIRTLTSAVASLPLGQTTALSVSVTAPSTASRIKFNVTLKSTKLTDQAVNAPSNDYVIASV